MVRLQCILATIVISLVNTEPSECSDEDCNQPLEDCDSLLTSLACWDLTQAICFKNSILCIKSDDAGPQICLPFAIGILSLAVCYNLPACNGQSETLECLFLSQCCAIGSSSCRTDCNFLTCSGEIVTSTNDISSSTNSTTSFSISSNPSTTSSNSTNVNTGSTTSFTTSYSLSSTLSTLSNNSTNTNAESSVSSEEPDNKTGLIIGVVIAGCVVIIALVLIIAVLIIIRRSRTRKRIEMQAGNQMESDYQRMQSKEIEPPTSRYEAMNVSPAKQDLESNHQMELNSHINGESVTDTGYDNACEVDEGYDNIGIDVLSEPSPAYEVIQNPTGKNISSGKPVPPGDSSSAYAVVQKPTGKNISPLGDSSETVLFDNQFYGDNSFKVPSTSNADKGDTTVIDNALYGR